MLREQFGILVKKLRYTQVSTLRKFVELIIYYISIIVRILSYLYVLLKPRFWGKKANIRPMSAKAVDVANE